MCHEEGQKGIENYLRIVKEMAVDTLRQATIVGAPYLARPCECTLLTRDQMEE